MTAFYKFVTQLLEQLTVDTPFLDTLSDSEKKKLTQELKKIQSVMKDEDKETEQRQRGWDRRFVLEADLRMPERLLDDRRCLCLEPSIDPNTNICSICDKGQPEVVAPSNTKGIHVIPVEYVIPAQLRSDASTKKWAKTLVLPQEDMSLYAPVDYSLDLLSNQPLDYNQFLANRPPGNASGK